MARVIIATSNCVRTFPSKPFAGRSFLS